MSTPHAAQAAKPRLHSLLNATFVTLRRVAALCVLAIIPGVALATTFTDTSGGGSFTVASSPLGGRAGCNLITGAHPYASRTLTTNNTTTYKFTVTSSTGFGNDPFLAVYLGTFNPANPTANLIACNDDANGTLLPEFEALLNANTTYTVVTTSYSTGVGGSATYNITPDVTLAGAPLLSAVSVNGVTTNTAVLQGTSNSAGTGYFVVQAAAQAAPSVAQVIAGQQSSGGAALSSGNGVMSANTSRTFNLASLQPGTAYTAYLVVRDNQTPQLTSVPSAANFTTVAIAPQAPVIGTATAGNTQATVAFTPPTNNGGSSITGYTVTSSPGGITATGTTSPITVTGLTNGTSYTFVVTATNSIGTSVNSAASNAVVPVGPAALTNFGPFARTFGDAPSAIAAPTSASSGAFTYSSSNPAVATISGDVVTVVSAGTTVITANQAANGAFTAGSITANLVVAKATPTLSGFNDLTRVFGDAPFNLVAPTSNSPGAITYSSSNPAVATVSGSTVTLVGAGSTALTASQVATANYEAGTATAQLLVTTAPPALGAFADLNATFGDAPAILVAPTSPSAGAFTYTSSNPAVATISGNVVTFTGAGTSTITAIQAADGNYAAAQATAQLTVGVAAPPLSNFNAINATFGDAPITLVAPTSPSAGAFTYSSSNPAVATVSGNVVTFTGAGTSTITAIQAADGNYAAAQTSAQLTVGVAAPLLSNFNAITATFGDAPITLVAPSSPSTGAFTYTSSNPAVATVSGNVVTIVGSGSAILTADQAAAGNYAAASITAPLNVGVGSATLSNFADRTATFGDAPLTLVAPTSPSAGAFTYTSSNPAVATISGNVVTLIGAGNASITATQAADGNYGIAQITAQLVVAAAVPTLGGFADLAATFGDAPITLTAPTSASAGGFTYTSSNPAVATISGSTVNIVGSGTTTLTATQAADGNYAAAQVTAQLQVGVAAPVLSNFGNLSATFGDAPITLTAPTSPSAGAFTYSSSNPAVATISGNTVTIVGSGTTTLTAVQAANGNYAAAQTSAQLQVGIAAPVLSNFGNLSATFGDAPITLSPPTSPSAGAFTYTSSNPAVATISGNVLTVVGSGVTTITATQAADGNYAGAQITAQLSVDTLAPSLTGFDDLSATYGEPSFVLVAPASPSAGAFTYTSSDPSVATISGNTVTVIGTGTTTITATQAANGSYAGASITAQLVVGAATPTITGFGDLRKIYGQAAFDLADPASNSSGAFTYTIDNAAVATVSGRTVTITGAGTATITATQAATANYTAASVTALLVVDSRPDPTQDAEVVSGLQAQMDTAQRFADAQQGNVRDRLRQRRGADAAGTANGLSINSTGGDGGVALKPELLEGGAASKAWSFWTGGAINTGERKARGNNDGYDFHSDGVTFGADKRFGKDVLLGVAVGGGWSDADVGANGSTVDAKQRALTVYGLWHASDSLFVDGQLAVGKLDYDLRRWSAVADTMGLAQRDGSQVFGSVTFGYESTHESRRLTSYGRVDAGRTTLDAYRETGLGIYDLDYREQTVEQRSVAVGLEGRHSVQVDWARDVRPYWQLEYRNDFSARSDAGINYVVAPADEDYRLSLKPWASSNWNVGFGADFAFGNGVIVTALLRHEVNVGMGSNTTVGLQFSLDFDGNPNAGSAGMQDATLQAPQAASKK